MSEVIRFDSVSFVRTDKKILDQVHFSLNQGDSLAIIGRNGAGKTTLINLLFGYSWPTTGSISAFGETYGETPMAPLQNRIGMVQPGHQETLLQRLTTFEMVLTGVIGTLGLYKDPTKEQEKTAESLLASIGLIHKKNQIYSTLSSGEKMKVLLLRAFGVGKEILVLDEPTATLDITARTDFGRSLAQLKNGNPHLTRILITHRIEEIPEDFSKILLLKEGKVISFGEKAKVLTDQNLSDLYDLDLQVNQNKGQYSVTVLS
ncbi:ATP-binding cassette domain-containing protein [Leptospira bourretii]|uniref:ATP-binding cassette domain-containing protein n=1 Tax=Leptospira bourretii TaxID=2484962 RepID=A0A4V3JLE5_9LEPT|nr:ATP-binding cassette domain-containing protein [Leptospira bourretii]TGK86323.1 ATP-binding cassette domain-containing protein [Leptospira bourretii]TGK92356.1 ATP-binding cassette domain-containing protein [Leptospira bourretii]TGL20594.1 ATP-binding cassette domain-containing protein [Leptospira bourretii]TGL26575.1 ATP-binding cassette domain-containing protein [Leptospira bourretii]